MQMWFLKKHLIKIEDEKFEKEYPFLITSPRVPMEEDLGISKEEVLENYEKFILNNLFDKLRKMGFKQRGKTSMFYKCLCNGIMVSINFRRNMKSFSIFSVNCNCIPLFTELEYLNGHSISLTKLDGLSIYDFDCQDEIAANLSYNYILEVIQTKAINWFESFENSDNVVQLFKEIKNFGNWDTPLSLLLREGELSKAIEEIASIKKDPFFTNNRKYELYMKDKLNYYEKLIIDGKEACVLAMQEREIKNKKRFKIK